MSLDYKEVAALLGKHCLVPCGEMKVECVILNVRAAWNRQDWQVQPVAGEGEAWVDASRCALIER